MIIEKTAIKTMLRPAIGKTRDPGPIDKAERRKKYDKKLIIPVIIPNLIEIPLIFLFNFFLFGEYAKKADKEPMLYVININRILSNEMAPILEKSPVNTTDKNEINR